MRPLKLIMSAFGPYANKVEIDLAKLGKSGLYLITGDTGAGKTTIFDGIVYALYGEASGQNRDGKILRAKHADDSTITEVSLEFELKNKMYKVTRSPEQLRPKSRGEGYTTRPAEASIILPDGKVITKTKDVTATVEQIIGIDASQFKQIAMIAQGEFLKLLNAPSEERTKIFRHIFKTENYFKLQERLSDNAKALNEEREKASESLLQFINGIECDDLELLPTLTLAKKGEITTSEVVSLLETLIEKDNALNGDLGSALNEAQLSLNEINKLIDSILEKEKIEGEVAKLRTSNDEKSEIFKKLIADLDLAKRERDEKNKKSQEELDRINAQLPKYEELENLKKRKSQIEKSLTELKQILAEQSDVKAKKEAEIQTLKANIENIEKDKAQKSNLDTFFAQKKAENDTLIRLNDEKTYLDATLETLLKEQKNCEYYLADLKIKSDDYTEKNQLFLSSQAGVLASKLTDGAPCFVCGSTSHPKKASLFLGAPSESELKSCKEQMDLASERAQKSCAKCSELKGAVEKTQNSIKSSCALLGINDDEISKKLETSKTDLQETEGKISKLNISIAKESVYRTRLDGVEKELKEHDAQINKTNMEISGEVRERDVISDSIATLGKSLNDSYENLVLSKQNAEKSIKEQNSKVESSESAKNSAEIDLAKLDTEIKSRKERLKDFKEVNKEECIAKKGEIEKKIAELEAQNKTVFARLDANKKSLVNIKTRLSDVETIEKHYKWVQTLNQTANGALKGKDRIMLETYIQMTYFDRIIERANERLLIMSGGTFELRRKTENNAKTGKVGLDLLVLDHGNGSVRDVRSLSGGESFKASLSLALGLSDEIQSSAGGVVLDTMFVDEGFGSLDDESLSQAMKALVGLAESNRLVGIISHVGELKRSIDKQIVVKKDKSGISTVNIIA